MKAKIIFFVLAKLYLLFFFRKLFYIDKRYEPQVLTVYSQDFYLRKYPEYAEIFKFNKKALFKYFNTTGISEGECASPAFDVRYYLEKNQNLRRAFGYNYTATFEYFLTKGCSKISLILYNIMYEMKTRWKILFTFIIATFISWNIYVNAKDILMMDIAKKYDLSYYWPLGFKIYGPLTLWTYIPLLIGLYYFY